MDAALAFLGPTPAEQKAAEPFRLHDPAPGVLPKGRRYAMDDFNGSLAWATQAYQASGLQGIAFLGYPFLAELSQRAEYYQGVSIIAEEMTRKWIEFTSVSENDKQTKKIKELESASTDFGLQELYRDQTQQDCNFGRAQLFIDIKGVGYEGPELMTPLGEPRSRLARRKVDKGALLGFRTIEATWSYPNRYNANNPLRPDWYKPDTWFVMAQQVHRTRLLTMIGRPVPDILKPVYMFGGLSVVQMMQPYVNNWLTMRQSVTDIARAFSIMVLSTNLGESLTPGGEGLFQRAALFTRMRDNRGVMMVDKDSEDLKNVSAPLGTLDALQAQAQEHQASVLRIPLVKLLGIAPHGLNASSDGEIRTFYDTVHAAQERVVRPSLDKAIDFIQLHLWGEIDDDISYKFKPLWELDDAGRAAVQKTKADIHDVYMTAQVVSPLEVRTALAADPDSPYQGLEPDDLPDPDDFPMSEIEDPSDPMTGRVDKAGEGSAAEITSGV